MTRGHIFRRSFALATVTAIVVAALGSRANAQICQYDLFIQGSPADAGTLTPVIGSHRVSANSTIPLTANALPGYQFAYWLGDVSDPSAERTIILVNEPKVVIAVFHRDATNRVHDQIGSAGAGGGGDMLALAATDLRAPAWTPGGGARTDTRVVAVVVPVVIPEPPTFILLALGLCALRRRALDQLVPVRSGTSYNPPLPNRINTTP